MTEKERTGQAKQAALKNGADFIGVVTVANLHEHQERVERMLPGANSVLVHCLRPQHRISEIRCQRACPV